MRIASRSPPPNATSCRRIDRNVLIVRAMALSFSAGRSLANLDSNSWASSALASGHSRISSGRSHRSERTLDLGTNTIAWPTLDDHAHRAGWLAAMSCFAFPVERTRLELPSRSRVCFPAGTSGRSPPNSGTDTNPSDQAHSSGDFGFQRMGYCVYRTGDLDSHLRYYDASTVRPQVLLYKELKSNHDHDLQTFLLPACPGNFQLPGELSLTNGAGKGHQVLTAKSP